MLADQARVRKGSGCSAAPVREELRRSEEGDLERERKEAARRTLELMEARRMVEVAMEGENAKKRLDRKSA